MRTIIKTVILSAALATLAGCVAGSVKKDAAGSGKLPTGLEERATQRWEMLIAHKAENAYDLLSPGFRATKTREVYALEMNNRPVNWTSVAVTGKECEDEEACVVSLSLNFTIPVHGRSSATPGFSVAHEKWIKVSGQWYFLPEQIGSSVLQKKG